MFHPPPDMKSLFRAVVSLVLLTGPVSAGIVSVVETGIAADTRAIIAAGFAEGVPALADRVHTHRGPAFDAAGVLNVNGVNPVALPPYLLGQPYVRFANDARENAGYSAVVTCDSPTIFYLLVDNRINGPVGAGNKTITTDPVLGGVLQWVIDGGWERVRTGMTPNGQGDFTAIDEANDGTRNNFYSVYRLAAPASSVTVRNNGVTGHNNICLIAAPAPVVGEPITSFAAGPQVISPGESATLSWIINTGATAASINQGIGSILPVTTNGVGTATVSPAVDTTYTLTVTAGQTATREAKVEVRPVASFTVDQSLIDAGAAVTLSWRIRPDAVATISGIGNIAALTAPDGTGSVTLNAAGTTTWTLTATAAGRTESRQVTAVTRPAGTRFALLDIGASDGRAEPDALTGTVIGAGPNNTNLLDLFALPLVSDTGVPFTLSIDNLAPDGTPVGGLDWRDRGNGPALGFSYLAEDVVKNASGLIHVTLSGLPAGTYGITSYLIDPTFSQCDRIRVLVTDAKRVAADAGTQADASFPGHPADTGVPGLAGLNAAVVDSKAVRFVVAANGVDDIHIWYDGRGVLPDQEVPLAGLWITQNPPPDSIVSFISRDRLVAPGAPATLSWIVAPDAAAASIDQGVGNVLAQTTGGVGNAVVTPLVDTVYTLTVASPAGPETATVPVAVRPIGSFAADQFMVLPGTPVKLSWRVRPDSDPVISGVGNVSAFTGPDGIGSVVVNPQQSVVYTLTAAAGGRTESASVTVIMRPAGTPFAVVDLGSIDGRPEAGALTGVVIGSGLNNTNGLDLTSLPLVSDTGVPFSLSVDAIDPSGIPLGAIDWRDRGDSALTTPLALLAEDHLKNNAGMIRLTLAGLPAGKWNFTGFLIDSVNSQCGAIRVLVTDADRTAFDTGILGNASWAGHPANTGAPGVNGLTSSVVDAKAVRLSFRSNGSNDVQIWFDGSADTVDREVPLAGFWLYQEGGGPQSVQILSLVPEPAAGRATLTFASSPGASYTVEASAALNSWTKLSSNVPSAGATTSFTETGIPQGTLRRFYRVSRN